MKLSINRKIFNYDILRDLGRKHGFWRFKIGLKFWFQSTGLRISTGVNQRICILTILEETK